MAERWQRAWMQDVDDRGRATVVIDPDPEAPWPKEETSFLVRVRRPRSPQHHRLYWGMLRAVVKSTARWPSADSLHKWVKYQLDMYEIAEVRPDGVIVIEWEPTDFESMDQTDFHVFFENAVAAIVFETGIDPLDLRKETTQESAVIHPDEVLGPGDDEWWK